MKKFNEMTVEELRRFYQSQCDDLILRANGLRRAVSDPVERLNGRFVMARDVFSDIARAHAELMRREGQ